MASKIADKLLEYTIVVGIFNL